MITGGVLQEEGSVIRKTKDVACRLLAELEPELWPPKVTL